MTHGTSDAPRLNLPALVTTVGAVGNKRFESYKDSKHLYVMVPGSTTTKTIPQPNTHKHTRKHTRAQRHKHMHTRVRARTHTPQHDEPAAHFGRFYNHAIEQVIDHSDLGGCGGGGE